MARSVMPQSPTETTENPSVVITCPGQVEIQQQAVPTPGPSEVLIRTRRSLISTGTELTLLAGEATGVAWQRLCQYPTLSGYANIGDVLAVGEGVAPDWIGCRVHNHGKHQAYTISPLDRIAKVPAKVQDEEATFTTLAKVTMNGLRRAGITWGESVVVVGLGIIGQLACRLCSLIGVRPTFAVERSPYRLGLLPEDRRIIPLQGDIASQREHVLVHNRGRLADAVIEATGNPDAIPSEPLLLRPQGRLLLLGSPRGASCFDFHDLCNRESLTIIGAHGFSHPQPGTPDNPWTSRRHGELFLDLLDAGELDTRNLISHRFPYQRAADAYKLLLNQRDAAMGVILEW